MAEPIFSVTEMKLMETHMTYKMNAATQDAVAAWLRAMLAERWARSQEIREKVRAVEASGCVLVTSGVIGGETCTAAGEIFDWTGGLIAFSDGREPQAAEARWQVKDWRTGRFLRNRKGCPDMDAWKPEWHNISSLLPTRPYPPPCPPPVPGLVPGSLGDCLASALRDWAQHVASDEEIAAAAGLPPEDVYRCRAPVTGPITGNRFMKLAEQRPVPVADPHHGCRPAPCLTQDDDPRYGCPCPDQDEPGQSISDFIGNYDWSTPA